MVGGRFNGNPIYKTSLICLRVFTMKASAIATMCQKTTLNKIRLHCVL